MRKGLGSTSDLIAWLSVSLATGGNPARLLGDAHRQSFDYRLPDGNANSSRLSVPPAIGDYVDDKIKGNLSRKRIRDAGFDENLNPID